jgi:hypothetical protein
VYIRYRKIRYRKTVRERKSIFMQKAVRVKFRKTLAVRVKFRKTLGDALRLFIG